MSDERVFVAKKREGNCMVCGCWRNLRVGTCFYCVDKVSEELVSLNLHRLWETKDPRNEWFHSTQGS